MAELRQDLDATASAVLKKLAAGPLTAWDLKMALKVSHTRLHLALGLLLGREKITLRPDKLTYMVESAAPATTPAQPAAEKAVL